MDAALKIFAFVQQKQTVLAAADPIMVWRYFQLAQLGYNVLADLQSLKKAKATEAPAKATAPKKEAAKAPEAKPTTAKAETAKPVAKAKTVKAAAPKAKEEVKK